MADKDARLMRHIADMETALHRRNEQIERLRSRVAYLTNRTADEALADAWDEGERHESEYLNTWGQFCPGKHCNPYRKAAND